MSLIKLVSNEDVSINYVLPHEDGGFFESRFVQRQPSYIIVYLSSHTGCNQACRFCHLTQTKQTMMTPASIDDYVEQAKQVLEDTQLSYLKEKGVTRIKFNFMARGEPLLNPTVVYRWKELRDALISTIDDQYFDIDFSISTILPKTFRNFRRTLSQVFTSDDVTLYYSMYSSKSYFRKKWLGNAEDSLIALQSLKVFKDETKNKVKIHSSFIKGVNDTEESVVAMLSEINYAFDGKHPPFNIVRYNPYSTAQGEETDKYTLEKIAKQLNAKIVSKVGFDVKASCGMFYQGN